MFEEMSPVKWVLLIGAGATILAALCTMAVQWINSETSSKRHGELTQTQTDIQKSVLDLDSSSLGRDTVVIDKLDQVREWTKEESLMREMILVREAEVAKEEDKRREDHMRWNLNSICNGMDFLFSRMAQSIGAVHPCPNAEGCSWLDTHWNYLEQLGGGYFGKKAKQCEQWGLEKTYDVMRSDLGTFSGTWDRNFSALDTKSKLVQECWPELLMIKKAIETQWGVSELLASQQQNPEAVFGAMRNSYTRVSMALHNMHQSLLKEEWFPARRRCDEERIKNHPTSNEGWPTLIPASTE